MSSSNEYDSDNDRRSDDSSGSGMDIEDSNKMLGSLFMQQKTVNNKQRYDEIRVFKTRLVDFLGKYYDKKSANNATLPQSTTLLKYALSSSDNSSKGLGQKIVGIINKFFSANKDNLLKKKFVKENKEEFNAIFQLMFETLGNKSTNKHNLHAIINIIKIFKDTKNADLQSLIDENSKIMLQNIFNHKDNSTFKIVLPNLLKSNAKIFENNCGKFIKLALPRSAGGAKSDMLRIENFKLLNSQFQRYLGSSSSGKKIEDQDNGFNNESLAVLINEIQPDVETLFEKCFNKSNANDKRFTKVCFKHLEFANIYCKACDTVDMVNKKESIQNCLRKHEENLPKDQNVKKLWEKITGIEIKKPEVKKVEITKAETTEPEITEAEIKEAEILV